MVLLLAVHENRVTEGACHPYVSTLALGNQSGMREQWGVQWLLCVPSVWSVSPLHGATVAITTVQAFWSVKHERSTCVKLFAR